jgi:hypothetical protein
MSMVDGSAAAFGGGSQAQEDTMSRSITLIAVCAIAFVCSAPSYGQDSPSLGDLARQAQKDQKDKTNKAPAKVFTNDDIPYKSSSAAPATGAGAGSAVQPASGGNADSPQSPAEGLERLQSKVDELNSLSRDELANSALEGDTRNFPGRAQWEDKLFAAKQTFVAQDREVLKEITQIETAAEGMKNVDDANDPRVKLMNAKLQQLVQQTQQYSAAFQAVMEGGKTLAGHAAGQ